MKNFIQKIGLNYVILLLGGFLVPLNELFFQNGTLGIIGFFLYISSLSGLIGEALFRKEKIENFFLGLLFILSEFIIGGTIIYYLDKITPLLSYSLLVLPLATFFLIKKTTRNIETLKQKTIPQSWKYFFLFGLPLILGDVFLLVYLYTHRTYELAASPWLQVGPIFFVLYTLATILLFITYKKNTSLVQTILLTSLHFFVGLSVAALIYPLGYGFDAFIHRATEEWIQTHGFIDPKTPYYIGQYTLVTMLGHITHLKIFWIDIFLVPILASIFLPGIILTTSKKFIDSPLYAQIGFWLLPFIPFLSLHLTTPHNLVLLLSILLIFLTWSASKKHISFLLPILLSLAGVMTHPLVGAPLFIFTFVLFLLQKFQNNKKLSWALIIITFLGLCFLLPTLFTLNGLRIGKPLPTLTNPFTHIDSFIDLFARPYWYAKTSPLRFEILYWCERLIVPAFLFLSAIGFVTYRKKEKSLWVWMFPLTALALFLDAWLLRSWIVFPDVVAYEQGDYPKRLIYTSIIFLLPFSMYGLYSLLQKLSANLKFKIIQAVIFLLIPITLTVCLYLSYPQRNVKIRFPGYNITHSDFKAVEWIQSENSEYNYIVLSNQLVSAAALTNYSFAKYFATPQGELFYYAIPTGGLLYQYYGKMIYEGQKREYMEEAMRVAGVQKAYFVVNTYWANSDKIIAEAKKMADQVKSIDNGLVWIFEYSL